MRWPSMPVRVVDTTSMPLTGKASPESESERIAPFCSEALAVAQVQQAIMRAWASERWEAVAH